MNDLVKWSQRMMRIGNYKSRNTTQWLKKTSLRQRVALTEELLLLTDRRMFKQSLAPLFPSLSYLVEKKHARKV